MDKRLFGRAVFTYLAGLLIIAALIFIPAGTFRYPQGWLFVGVLFGPMLILGIVLMLREPELLRRRLDSKEKESAQKAVIGSTAVMFIAAFVLAGLNFRFGWIMLPMWVSYAAAAIFLICYALYGEVMRENVWLSRNILVQEGQQVVDTGMYGIVRHPMYAVTLVLFLMMPLVMGSVPSFLVMLLYIPAICVRIRNEEKVLGEELEGYEEYKEKVRWRLIPYIW